MDIVVIKSYSTDHWRYSVHTVFRIKMIPDGLAAAELRRDGFPERQ